MSCWMGQFVLLASVAQSYNQNMYKFLTQRLVIAWVAMLSVLFGALAPAISHAMAAPALASAVEEIQVCTMEGMKTIVLTAPSTGKPSAPASDHMSKHCACCTAHSVSLLPPALAFSFPLVMQSSERPSLFYHSATPLFA